jgi:hypothetical protein
MKTKREGLFVTAKRRIKMLITLFAVIMTMAFLAISASANTVTPGAVDWSLIISSGTIDAIVVSITGILPIVFPIVITIIGITLGIKMFKRLAK